MFDIHSQCEPIGYIMGKTLIKTICFGAHDGGASATGEISSACQLAHSSSLCTGLTFWTPVRALGLDLLMYDALITLLFDMELN